MSQTKGFRTANRRYRLLFWPLTIGYVAISLLATQFIDELTSPAWLRIAGAIAITLPLLGVLYSIRRLTEETDEYTRMRQIRAMRDGGLITAGAAFFTGFLQIFDVIDPFTVFWFGPLFFVSYGLSACFSRLGPTV